MDLADLPATELVALFRSKAASPVEACRATLARIERHDQVLNAYKLVDPDGALAAARESERRWVGGAPLSALDGVPTSIKDMLLTRGWPTLRGSRLISPEQLWDVDAPAVSRLREGGAVLLGKTNTAEFGWKGTTDSPLAGITRNPWNPALTPGGSSGGAAASLAAGMATLALCTDGGGSVRNPAGFTNLVGFKASYGRVAAYPPNPIGTVANVCPMARTVADIALMMSAIGRPDPRDWLNLPAPGFHWRETLAGGARGLRVAFSPGLGFAAVVPEIAAGVNRAAHVLAGLGATVEQIDPPLGNTTDTFNVHWKVGLANALGGLPDAKLALLDRDLDKFVHEGRAVTLSRYGEAQSARVAAGGAMRSFHASYDVLLLPTTAVPAFPVERRAPPGIDEDDYAAWTPFSYPFNLTMQPAISVPCGFTAAGLPYGVQFVGDLYRDDIVLRVAAAYEAANPLYERRAPVVESGLSARERP